MADILIDKYEGKSKHVDTTVVEGQFMDASRTLVYAATGNPNNPTPFRKVGLIQSYGWSENREVTPVYEIGSDIFYMVPGRTSGGISISRILLSGKDLLNAIFHGDASVDPEKFLKSLGDTSIPIHFMFANYANTGEKETGLVYSRIFANCHITSRRESIGAGQRVIMENASILYGSILEANVSTK